MNLLKFNGKKTNFINWKIYSEKKIKIRISVSWSGEGVEVPLCIKIGYSEPTCAQSRERTSTLAESSLVFFGVVMLDSDWLSSEV